MCYFLFALLLSQPLLNLFAFSNAPERLHLIKVQFSGSNRYTQEDLVRASGLNVPSQVTQDDLQQAANRLGGSGAFSSIQFTFKPAAGIRGVEADFAVQDSRQLLPADYDNFLWFSDAELAQAIHTAVPLYAGVIPQSGSMADDVKSALHALLLAKGLPHNVSYELAAVGGATPFTYRYKVDDASFTVKEFTFIGVKRVSPELLARAVDGFRGESYSSALLKSILEKNLLPVYRDRGFLQAKIDELKPQLHASDVSLEVDLFEGEQYKLRDYRWSGNTVIPAEELARQIRLKPGEPVNFSALEDDLGKIRKTYGRFGREAAMVKPVPTYVGDTVTYLFDVTEGDLYRMGKLQIEGVEPGLAAKLAENWKLAAGAPYDNTYVVQFFKNVAQRMPNRSWEWLTFEDIDSASKLVNVRLQLTRK